MNRTVTNLTAVSFFVVLLGQLGFKAVAYYFGITHPSWAFWLALYAALAVFGIRRFNYRRLGTMDMLFLGGIVGAVLNFAVLGEGDSFGFVSVVAVIWLGPYLIGRVHSQHILRHGVPVVYAIAALTAVLVIWQVIQRPELMNSDRLVLFTPHDWDGWGGDGTQSYVGMSVGVAVMLGFSTLLSWAGRPVLSVRFYALCALIAVAEVFLLYFGSRSSLLVFLLSCVLLTCVCGSGYRTRMCMLLLYVLCVPVMAYPTVPESRGSLIGQLFESGGREEAFVGLAGAGRGYSGISETGGECQVDGHSTSIRLVLLREALRVFEAHPVFGIGAGNYGLNYCGLKREFVSPHNIVAQLLAEYGLIGSAPWLLLFFMILKRIWSALRTASAGVDKAYRQMLLVWFFFVAVSMFTGNIYIDFNVFMLTGVVLSLFERTPCSDKPPGPGR